MIAEASFNGTVKTILILLALWWVVRLIMRARSPHRPTGTTAVKRPVGDVRIEDAPKDASARRAHGTIIDADYEEIK